MTNFDEKVNNNEVKPISVYLAGKIAGDKWKLVENLPTNIANIESSDGTNHSEHLTGVAIFQLGHDFHKEYVYDFAIKSIHNSDILIAYLDCATSYGSIAEIAYASAHGRPCHILVNCDKYLEPEDDFFDAYWFICAFPLVHTVHINNILEAKSYIWSIVYKEYHKRVLKGSHWKSLKLQAIHRAGNRCQLCNAKGRLHVHHRTYENIGNESLNDLIVLCNDCHEKFHDK